MNTTRTEIRRTTTLIVRLVVLVAGLACLLCFSWDTPLVAGRVGCLILGVRVWVIGLALLATAAVWVPEESVGNGPTQPAKPGNAVYPPLHSPETSDVRGMIDGCATAALSGSSHPPRKQDREAETSHLVV